MLRRALARRAASRARKNPPLSCRHPCATKAAPFGAASSINPYAACCIASPVAACRLQAVEIIGGLLRVAGGGEDRALVVLQDLQPRRDVSGVVVAGFRGDAKIGAEERRADFRDKLFHGVACIGETLAA